MTNPHTELFKDKRVIVMGLGRFGGGAGAANYAASLGATVTISDRATADQLETGLAKIKSHLETGAITLSLGEHDESLLETADILIVNPAVPHPWDNPYIALATALGVTIDTEIGLTTDRLTHSDSTTIAITGSVGKSTTAAMTHHALQELGVPTILGGNIGGSLLNHGIPSNATAVLELSSAMLHWLRETRPAWSPSAAVLTSYEPNHLDWHATEPHYRAAKQHLLDTLENTTHAHAILGPSVVDWATPSNATRHAPSALDTQLVLPGEHNRTNAALAAAAIAAVTPNEPNHTAIADAIATFPGLPHRLAFAGSRRAKTGLIACYNDSKSTTPGTTAAAVEALRERHDHIWLIAGGADKNIDLASLASLKRVTLLTIGTTGPAIAAAAEAANTPHDHCHTLDAAVAHAASNANPDDALLLSPACASWDQFENYEARGHAFLTSLDTHLGPPQRSPQ